MPSRKAIMSGVGATLGVLMLGFAVIFVMMIFQQRSVERKRELTAEETRRNEIQEERRRRFGLDRRKQRRTPAKGAQSRPAESEPASMPEAPEPIFAQPKAKEPVYIPIAPIRKVDPRPIRIGILHALSGPLSLRETALKDVALLTIDELNRRGGVLGRRLQPVVMATHSSWTDFADKAKRLVEKERVAVTFGCWDSTARRSVLNVFESHRALLFYPRYYAGDESSPSLFYTGGTPNQRAVPAAQYLLSIAGGQYRRFVLLGTDDVYARTSNRIVRHLLRQHGVRSSDILELYAPQDTEDFSALVDPIHDFVRKGRTAVLSSIEGDSNRFFYMELSRRKLFPDELPVLALALDENLIADLTHEPFVGRLVVSNYVMSNPSAENDRFLASLRRWQARAYTERGGDPTKPMPRIVADETMAATYEGILLWAQAVEQAGTPSPLSVRQALAGQYLQAPSGMIEEMDRRNHHLHKPVFISRITLNGALQVVYESRTALDPDPFSDLVPETARKVADWTYPNMCANCTQPRFPDLRDEFADISTTDPLWPLSH